MAAGVVPSALQWLSLTAGTGSAGPALDRAPDVVADEQPVRLGRPLRAGLVLADALVAAAPRLHDRVDDPPLGLDLVVSREERRLAAHGVEDEPLVGLGGLRQERRAVEELHVHRRDTHARAGDLRGELERDPLVRL